jgi:hypothetical protein
VQGESGVRPTSNSDVDSRSRKRVDGAAVRHRLSLPTSRFGSITVVTVGLCRWSFRCAAVAGQILVGLVRACGSSTTCLRVGLLLTELNRSAAAQGPWAPLTRTGGSVPRSVSV